MQPPNSTTSTANREIAALVFRLLQHYWTGDDSPEARQAQIEDWIEDLREFGPAIVTFACREWRQTNDRRPTPAGIRLLCIAEQIRQSEVAAKRLPQPPTPPEPPELSPEERREAAQMFGELAEMLQGRRPWPDGTVSFDPARKHLARPLAASLAAAAREYDPEALRAGRIALGLEQPHAEAAE